jgi:hypothetical protein
MRISLVNNQFCCEFSETVKTETPYLHFQRLLLNHENGRGGTTLDDPSFVWTSETVSTEVGVNQNFFIER